VAPVDQQHASWSLSQTARALVPVISGSQFRQHAGGRHLPDMKQGKHVL
jgi:hypothetical protein